MSHRSLVLIANARSVDRAGLSTAAAERLAKILQIR
jgi:hypothetical protein